MNTKKRKCFFEEIFFEKGFFYCEDFWCSGVFTDFIRLQEELINDHKTFIRHKPELRALLEDFCQFVLLRKPDDVCSFASHYFASFSTKMKPPAVPSTVPDGSAEQ